MQSVFLVTGLDRGNKKHKSIKLPGAELSSVPTSICCLHFPRWIWVQLVISISLAITPHRLVHWPTARGGENRKERSNPFRSLLNSNHHCVGLPRRSPRTASSLQKVLSCWKQFGSCIGIRRQHAKYLMTDPNLAQSRRPVLVGKWCSRLNMYSGRRKTFAFDSRFQITSRWDYTMVDAVNIR
jgi:hypothetical protein